MMGNIKNVKEIYQNLLVDFPKNRIAAQALQMVNTIAKTSNPNEPSILN